jgi:hypothetical protein
MSQRHVLGEGNMTLLFDESFGLKSVVKVKLHFPKSLLQQLFVIYGFLTEFRRKVLVLCQLISRSNLNIAVLLFTARRALMIFSHN